MMLTDKHEGHYGYYCGQDAALVLSPEFNVAFLRLTQEHLVTAMIKDGRVVGVVSGHRMGKERHVYMMLQATERRFVRPDEALEELVGVAQDFAACHVEFTGNDALCTFAGQEFRLALGDAIDLDAIRRPQPVDDSLSVAEKMRAWNVDCWYIVGEKGDTLHSNISNGRFDCHWELNWPEGVIYCRLGVSGYCAKGWAMLPTSVFRAQACGMLADHRDALLPYRPNEECFVPDGCAFPDDGGWYWSVKDVTPDCITLNGCGGATYTIYRPR